jgi:hypothetical protein
VPVEKRERLRAVCRSIGDVEINCDAARAEVQPALVPRDDTSLVSRAS